MEERRRRAVRAALRLIGPALLVALLLRLDGAGAALVALGPEDAAPLAAAMLLGGVNYLCKALRWRGLLAARGRRYGLLRAWASLLSSGYVGLLTPGRVGDVLRIQYVRHDLGVPYAEGLALLAVDRIFDIYVLLAFAAVGAAYFGGELLAGAGPALWLGVAALALGPLVLLAPASQRRMARALVRVGFAAEGAERFFAGLRGQRPREVAAMAAWTGAAFAINYVQGWIVARALGLPLGALEVVALLAVSSLLGLLPISVSGVGVRELFFALSFPILGLSAEAGVVYGLGVFVVIYAAAVLMGAVSWQVAPPPVSGGAPTDGDQRGAERQVEAPQQGALEAHDAEEGAVERGRGDAHRVL